MEVLLVREPDADGSPGLRVGLRMGEKRLYVVRSLPQLIHAIDHGELLCFGKGFTLQTWMRFTARDERILQLLRTLFSAAPQQYDQLRGRDMRLVSLPEPFAEQLLQLLDQTPFRFGS